MLLDAPENVHCWTNAKEIPPLKRKEMEMVGGRGGGGGWALGVGAKKTNLVVLLLIYIALSSPPSQ